jgi:hypothetical protein
MDSGTVKTFTDAAAMLLPALVQLASTDPAQRSPEDDAMIRQLRVAAGAIAHALMETPRQQPPNIIPPRPPDVVPAATAQPAYTA